MRLPRFLWVPFELGRPFGAPHEPDFQRRVLRAALELLERDDGPVVLEDFPDDAPVAVGDGGEAWSCPVSFQPTHDDETELVRDTLDEMAQLAPWHELYTARTGRSAPAASGLSQVDIVRGLGDLAEDETASTVTTNRPLIEWVRLGCDDVRTWYLEAARGRPGTASSTELNAWFWEQTAFARLIAEAATTLARSSDPGVQLFARRSMVPRAHMPALMPGVAPSAGELVGPDRTKP